MKGYSGWDYRPYIPADLMKSEISKPYICRIQPSENGFSGEWYDNGKSGKTGRIFVSERSKNDYSEFNADNGVFSVTGLECDKDYVFYVENESQTRSRECIVTTEKVPGVCIDFLHKDDNRYIFSGNYLCSPSICRVPSGALIASSDVFGDCGQNFQKLYRSDDDGKTWRYLTDLMPSYWGQLFFHGGKLYMFSASREYGNIQIGVSTDEGLHWKSPVTIYPGGCFGKVGGWHRGPMNFLRHKGRIWTGVEYGTWADNPFSDGSRFSSTLFSFDENTDPMIPENWTVTEPVRMEKYLFEKDCVMEGNAVAGRDGEIYDFMRYLNGKAVLYRGDVQSPEKALEFVDYIDFPMAHTKFEIFDYHGKYLAVGNLPPMRTQLALMTSENLRDWSEPIIILDCSDRDKMYNAFQYPSAFIENDTLYLLSRTSLNGAHSYHDSNQITFHKFDLTKLI